MTQAKKLKKTIRARALKTGESYTAARHQVMALRQSRDTRTLAPAAAKAPPAPMRAQRGGVSEAAAIKATGHGLQHWFALLDGSGKRGHTALARHLAADNGVPGWHAQGITVAYERARGLRAANQVCSGDFQVSVSRVVPVSVAEAAAAIHGSRRRQIWLQDADVALVSALVSALEAALRGPKRKKVVLRDADLGRLRYDWDDTRVEISLTATAAGRTSVAASSTGLRDAAMVEQRRGQWKVALDGLRRHLRGE